jgi:ABC-type thiamin/hydroxymethylpyrimidine transport system permease subunit
MCISAHSVLAASVYVCTNYSANIITLLAFTMETDYVLCEVGSGIWYIIQMMAGPNLGGRQFTTT